MEKESLGLSIYLNQINIMGAIYNVTLTGTGQLNGIVLIDKTIQCEEQVAYSFQGPNSDAVITGALAVYYPGVKVDPRQIGVSMQEVQSVKQSKSIALSKHDSNSSASILNTSVFLLPFKLVGAILKFTFKLLTK